MYDLLYGPLFGDVETGYRSPLPFRVVYNILSALVGTRDILDKASTLDHPAIVKSWRSSNHACKHEKVLTPSSISIAILAHVNKSKQLYNYQISSKDSKA